MALVHRSVAILLFGLIFTCFAEGQIHDEKVRTFFWKPPSGVFEFPVPNRSVNTKTTTKEKNHLANWTDFDGYIDVDIYLTPNVKEDPLTEEFIRSVGEKPTFLGKEQKGTAVTKTLFSKMGTPKLAETCYSMEPKPGLVFNNVMVFAYYPKQQELYQIVIRVEKSRYKILDIREHFRRIKFGADAAPLPPISSDVPDVVVPVFGPDLEKWVSPDKKFLVQYPKNVGLKVSDTGVPMKDNLVYSMKSDKKDLQFTIHRYEKFDAGFLTPQFLSNYIQKNFKVNKNTMITFREDNYVLSAGDFIGEYAGQKKMITLNFVVIKPIDLCYVTTIVYDGNNKDILEDASTISQFCRWSGFVVAGSVPDPEPKNPTPTIPPVTPEPKNPITPPTPKTPNPTPPTPPKTENPPFNPGPTFSPPTPTPPNEKTSSTTSNTKETTFWTTRNTVLIAGGGALFLLGVGIGGVLLLVKMMKSKSEDDSDDEDDRPRKKSSSAKRNNRYDDEDNRPRNRPQRSGSSERSKSSQPPKKKRPVDHD